MREQYEYADDYYNAMHEESVFITKINKEMGAIKEEALLKITKALEEATQTQLENFAEILAEGITMEMEPALKLAEELNLDKIDVICLLGNYEEYLEVRNE